MPSRREGWRGTRSWEGTQPGQLTQSGQRDIPYQMTPCPVYKLGGAGWERRMAAQGLAEHQSAGGEQLHYGSLVFSWVLFHSFCYLPFRYKLLLLLLLSSSFYFIVFLFQLVNCSYLNPRVSLVFDSPPHPTGGGREE